MGFIRNLFTSGGSHDGEPASPRNQNVWRNVFNPGSPQPRFAKGSAGSQVDKPDPARQERSVMDEIVRAPSVGQAKVSDSAVGGGSGGGAPSSPSAAAAAQASRAQADRSPAAAAQHEFGGMDKHGFGA